MNVEGLLGALFGYWYLRKTEEEKLREFRIALGWKNCSRVPKRAARRDEGRRREHCCLKAAKPRDEAAILQALSAWMYSANRARGDLRPESVVGVDDGRRRSRSLTVSRHRSRRVNARKLCAGSQHSYISTAHSRTPRQPQPPNPPPANWSPWLLSLRHVGCRHVLRRSSCATPARGEVSLSPIGHGLVADSNAALHAGQPSLAAQNFNMPALSPTMTEGNIATWKIKEGTTNPTHHDR